MVEGFRQSKAVSPPKVEKWKSGINIGKTTVDGRNPAPVDMQGFIHPRWFFWSSEPSTVW